MWCHLFYESLYGEFDVHSVCVSLDMFLSVYHVSFSVPCLFQCTTFPGGCGGFVDFKPNNLLTTHGFPLSEWNSMGIFQLCLSCFDISLSIFCLFVFFHLPEGPVDKLIIILFPKTLICFPFLKHLWCLLKATVGRAHRSRHVVQVVLYKWIDLGNCSNFTSNPSEHENVGLQYSFTSLPVECVCVCVCATAW